jgi:hypothetical protein
VEVVPTSAGNVIAAVHSYAHETYGVDATLVLPRLRLLLKESETEGVVAAEENLSLLHWSGIATLTVGFVGFGMSWHASRQDVGMAILAVSIAMFLLVVLPAIVSATVRYADQLRLMFDRHRGVVLASLGVDLKLAEQGSVTVAQEKALWLAVQQWWEYGAAFPLKYRLPGIPAAESEASPAAEANEE